MKNITATVRCVALSVLATMSILGCRRKDERDFEIKVPELTRANATQVVRPLAAYEGLVEGSISIDPDSHVVRLRYDSMKVAKKNLEMAIALAGYEANGITPESVGAKRASAPAAPKPPATPAKPSEAK